jgi:hypothetical protein
VSSRSARSSRMDAMRRYHEYLAEVFGIAGK